MTSKIWILCLPLIVCINAFAAPIVIDGNTTSGDVLVIRLYEEKDPISGLSEWVSQTRPDKQGNFTIHYNTNEIRKVNLMIGFQGFDLYVEPEKVYKLKISGSGEEEQTIFNPENMLQIEFEREDILNLVIDGFEIMYNDFLKNKFLYLLKSRNKKIFIDFKDEVLEKLSETKLENRKQKDYFDAYVKYRLADIELAAQLKEKEILGMEMIHEKSILFNNTSYADFFLKYFDNYLKNTRTSVSSDSVIMLINTKMNTSRIEDILGGDLVLKREQIRQLVFIYSLKQIYHQKGVSKANVKSILTAYTAKSKFSLNRQIALSVLESLTRLEKGNPFPGFEFNDQNNELKSIKNYKGKYVYLMFIHTDCETCKADMRILTDLMSEYEDVLQTATIFTGNTDQELKQLLYDLKPSWDVLWFADDYKYLNDLKIRTFPRYFLIDSEGNLAHLFPPSPRENFMSMVEFLRKSETKTEKGVDDLFRKN
jgi:thiol-disulfide isomerase/thioredoxin